jgi:hypothetical protein
VASKKTSETRYTSESQHHWWNGAPAKLFAAGAGVVLAYSLFHGVSNALDRKPKQYTATTTQFDCTVGTLTDKPVVTGVEVVGEAHVTCAKTPKSATLTVTMQYRGSDKVAWAPVGKPQTFTGLPPVAGKYVFAPVPCMKGQFQQTYALSGNGTDGSALSYAPVASAPVTVALGECQ